MTLLPKFSSLIQDSSFVGDANGYKLDKDGVDSYHKFVLGALASALLRR